MSPLLAFHVLNGVVPSLQLPSGERDGVPELRARARHDQRNPSEQRAARRPARPLPLRGARGRVQRARGRLQPGDAEHVQSRGRRRMKLVLC